MTRGSDQVTSATAVAGSHATVLQHSNHQHTRTQRLSKLVQPLQHNGLQLTAYYRSSEASNTQTCADLDLMLQHDVITGLTSAAVCSRRLEIFV